MFRLSSQGRAPLPRDVLRDIADGTGPLTWRAAKVVDCRVA